VEASALHAPSLTRVPLGSPLLRLRSDEQLLALFRNGSEDAFGVLHDRYRQRLFAYVRQMLSPGSRQDAEDVMQDVFVRAYGALRADQREINVRAWLYRVAHNRCIDHLRRPVPPAAEIFEMSRKPLHDPIEEAQRREDLKRLVEDVGRLPDQQRSALLMREIDGMSYADLADALDVTVPAVKSLLVRARVGLVEAAEARDADCQDIRADLLASYDRGVKASGRARKHMRSCSGCREYRTALKGMRRSFAALSPAAVGIGGIGTLLGLGGGGGTAASGSAAAGGGAVAATAGGTIATATVGKVAAVVAATAIAGGAVEAHKLRTHTPAPPAAHSSAPAVVPLAPRAPAPLAAQPIARRTAPAASFVAATTAAELRAAERRKERRQRAAEQRRRDAKAVSDRSAVQQTEATATAPATGTATTPATSVPADAGSGGVQAPDTSAPASNPSPSSGTTAPSSGSTPSPGSSGGSGASGGGGSTAPSDPAQPPAGSGTGEAGTVPPPEH
jgi:RNA polymerase sigma factor (sigma-70 family)